jgi:hypothetical protein
MKNKPLKWSLILITLFVLTAFLILPSVRFSGSNNSSAPASQDAWANATFVTIDRSEAFKTALQGSIQSLENLEALSSPQKANLYETLEALLYAFNDGSYAAFARHRFGGSSETQVLFRPAVIDRLKEHIPDERVFNQTIKEQKISAKYNVSSGSGVLETYWDLIARHATIKGGRKAYCTSCWKGFSPETLQLTVRDSDSPPDPVFKVMNASGIFNGYTPETAVVLVPTPNEILVESEVVRSIYLQFVVATDQTVPRYPVFASFYWIPERQTWAPWQIGVGALGPDIRYLY